MHNVTIFKDGVHVGLAIRCADGWYKFEYAADGGKVASSNYLAWFRNKPITAHVTVRRDGPTGESWTIGQTSKGLQEIINHAKAGTDFHGTVYDLRKHNCRLFVDKMCDFMELGAEYKALVTRERLLAAREPTDQEIKETMELIWSD